MGGLVDAGRIKSEEMNPPPATWTPYVVAVLTLVSAFLLAGQKWKRDRHLALFNKGKVESPDPPPNPLWAWIKRNVDLFTGIVVPLGMLAMLSQTYKGKFSEILLTALFCVSIASTLFLRFIFYLVGRLLERMQAMVETQFAMTTNQGQVIGIQEKMSGTNDKLVSVVERLVSRLEQVETTLKSLPGAGPK